jgi:hypothetical protein
MVAFATVLTSRLIFIAIVIAHSDWMPVRSYPLIFNQTNMSQNDYKMNNARVIVNREQTM